MSLSRRTFVRTLGLRDAWLLAGAFVAARGREAAEAERGSAAFTTGVLVSPPKGEIRINSNENPLGPGKTALDALTSQFNQAGRYPMNSRRADSDLMAWLAKRFGAKPEQIVLGAGSREILRNAVRAFTGPDRPLVTAAPSFEQPSQVAELIGTPVKRVAVDSMLRLDLAAMAATATGAGLVFVCNPNNPTATVNSAAAITELVARVHKVSPKTTILIDEAYHEYVTDAEYASAVPLALEHPNVLVSRTFSKAFGMAGLRIGYGIGQVETMKTLARYRMPYNANVLGIAAAMASLEDPAHIERESVRNRKVRRFTTNFFEGAGFKTTESQTNFIFVDVRRPANEFREACRARGVLVGRDFPPFEKTHSRISIGTMDEMQRAVEVFRKVLGVPASSAARG